VTAYFFGGISLLSDPAGSVYESLMHRESPQSITMLDPNIRQDFIADEASYRARLDRMIGSADIVKVSDEDLDWISHGKSIAEAVADFFAQDVAIVMVTQGSKGATLFTQNLTLQAQPPAVTVVDTVGAGDTFNAGFLSWLSHHDKLNKGTLAALVQDEAALTQALQHAVHVSARAVETKGANPPWASEL